MNVPFKRGPWPLALVVLALGACSTTPRSLTTSAAAEHARGQVVAHDEGGGHKRLDLEVTQLLPARALAPDSTAYVVWLEPLEATARAVASAPARKAGALKVSDNGSARFETTTDLRRFRVFITAEPSVEARRPSGAPVLWSDPMGENP